MTELKPFQLEGARAIRDFGGKALLADEQGLGKTIQSLYWVFKLKSRRPVIIVTPASLKWTWQAEANGHFGMRTEVLEGKTPKFKTLPCDILIINYDILTYWVKRLRKFHPKIVIFDEIHYLRDPNSLRTKAAFKLAQRADSVIGLTGTPIGNHLIEIWPILNMLRPDIFGSQVEFAWAYTKPRLRFGKWQFRGAKNKKKLRNLLLETCMIRRLKKDYLKDLPEKQFKVITCKLKSYKEYNEATADILAWLKKKSPARAYRARKAKDLVKVGYLLRLAARLKLPFVIQWLKEFHELHPNRKLVGFTMNTFVLEELKKVFKDKMLIIDGSVKGRKRFETVRRFQSSKKEWLVGCNWTAGSVGLTLTRAFDVAAFDLPWTPGTLGQGLDRVHRIGQTKQVTAWILLAHKTIEEKLFKGLKERQKTIDAILNGRGSARAFEENIFEELLADLWQQNTEQKR